MLPRTDNIKTLFCLLGTFLLSISCGGGNTESDSLYNETTFNAEVFAKDWLINPHDLAYDSDGNLLVASNFENQIALITPDGKILHYYELDESYGFESTCVATTTSGNSYVLNSTGLYYLKKDGTSNKISQWELPYNIAHMCAGAGEELFVTVDNYSDMRGVLYKINVSSFPSSDIYKVASCEEMQLRDIDQGPNNNLFAFSASSGRIIKFDPNGNNEVFKTGFSYNIGPVYLTFTPNDTIFLADPYFFNSTSQPVTEIDLNGNITLRYEFWPYGEMLFHDDGSYYTLDIYSSQLIKYSPQGDKQYLLAGKVGRSLEYMPNGAMIGFINAIGQYEYFPNGTIIKNTNISTFIGNENSRYIFDSDGNTYLIDDKLYVLSPTGDISILIDNLNCEIAYHDENRVFSEYDKCIYVTGKKDNEFVIMKYCLDGTQSVFYENQYQVWRHGLDVDINGNIYYAFQKKHDYSYHLLKITSDGEVRELYTNQGVEVGAIMVACSKLNTNCYFTLRPFKFLLYHLTEDGEISRILADTDIKYVDPQGLEVSEEGDIYYSFPGIIYRFSNKIHSEISISENLQPIVAEIGQIIDVVIPGNGFSLDTAIESNCPGVWIYQRKINYDSLSFKLAIREKSIKGEYDIYLHNPGQEKITLNNILTIE